MPSPRSAASPTTPCSRWPEAGSRTCETSARTSSGGSRSPHRRSTRVSCRMDRAAWRSRSRRSRWSPGTGGVKRTEVQARLVREAGPRGSPYWCSAALHAAIAAHLAGKEPDLAAALEQAEFDARGFALPHAAALAHQGVEALRRGQTAEGTPARPRGQAGDRRGRARGLPDGHVRVHRRGVRRGNPRGDAPIRAGSRPRLVTARSDERRDRTRPHPPAADPRPGRAAPVRPDGCPSPRGRGRRGSSRRSPMQWCSPTGSTPCAGGSTATDDLPGTFEMTAAEQRVLEQLETHLSLAAIADHLYVSRNTVKSHTLAIYRKLGVAGRGAAVERARSTGLLPAPRRRSRRRPLRVRRTPAGVVEGMPNQPVWVTSGGGGSRTVPGARWFRGRDPERKVTTDG